MDQVRSESLCGESLNVPYITLHTVSVSTCSICGSETKWASVWRVSLEVRLGCTGQDLTVSTWLPFPKSVGAPFSTRLGCTGQDLTVSSPGSRGYTSVNYYLIYYEERGTLWHGQCMRSTECLLVDHVFAPHRTNCVGCSILLPTPYTYRAVYIDTNVPQSRINAVHQYDIGAILVC